MTTRCRVSPDRTGWCAWWTVALATIVCATPSFALHRQAIESTASAYLGRHVVLKQDIPAPARRGEDMQAPMRDAKGWHHAAASPVLSAGSTVEVTGVFNYAERGLFLELAADPQQGAATLIDRPRIRIRLMIETPSTDPAAQMAEAARLMESVFQVLAPEPR